MLTDDMLFTLSSRLAMVGWLLLAFLPHRGRFLYRLTGLGIPCILAMLYGALMAASFATAEGGGYGSLAQVKELFSEDRILLAGWIHYLAFDLAVGTWIAKRATEVGLSRIVQVPILFMTLMFGPVGFLLFIVTEFGLKLLQSPVQRTAS
ncbi:MAG: ABA4-like family protein [Pseudomonadota bacterium]